MCWWYNKKYDRSGHLFQERFKSEPVEDEKYLATVFRYIHQNPIKAGIEDRIGNYKWSSYFEYKSRNFFVVNPKTMIGLFGNYGEMMEFVSVANEDVCMEYMSDKKSDEDVVNIILNIKQTILKIDMHDNSVYTLRINKTYED